jgi:hypothetical protein
VYYLAILLDLLLRLGWALVISPEQPYLQQHFVLMLGVLELLRRFMWTVFRVEWEAIRTARGAGSGKHLSATGAVSFHGGGAVGGAVGVGVEEPAKRGIAEGSKVKVPAMAAKSTASAAPSPLPLTGDAMGRIDKERDKDSHLHFAARNGGKEKEKPRDRLRLPLPPSHSSSTFSVNPSPIHTPGHLAPFSPSAISASASSAWNVPVRPPAHQQVRFHPPNARVHIDGNVHTHAHGENGENGQH